MSDPLPRLSLGLHYDVPVTRYYTDDLLEGPTLSRSEALVLVDQSPLHCWMKHPRLSNCATDDPTKGMDFGSLGHKLVLGRGAEIEVVEAEDWRTKDAKAARDDIRAAGRIPALRKDFDRGDAVAQSFFRELERFDLRAVWDAGQSEVIALWDEGGGVQCRCLLDRLAIDEEKKRAVILDPKFSDALNPQSIGRHLFNQNYHVQEQWYTRGVEFCRPELGGRVDFIFLFMETEPPYQMVPVTLNGEFKMLGISKAMRAVDAWKACLKAGRWPGYTEQVVRAEPPTWALNAEMGSNAIKPI